MDGCKWCRKLHAVGESCPAAPDYQPEPNKWPETPSHETVYAHYREQVLSDNTMPVGDAAKAVADKLGVSVQHVVASVALCLAHGTIWDIHSGALKHYVLSPNLSPVAERCYKRIAGARCIRPAGHTGMHHTLVHA